MFGFLSHEIAVQFGIEQSGPSVPETIVVDDSGTAVRGSAASTSQMFCLEAPPSFTYGGEDIEAISMKEIEAKDRMTSLSTMTAAI